MPRVKSYTAPWLSNSSPGYDLFAPPADKPTSTSPYASRKKPPPPGPRRTIARRGTEVFVAIGKELRWGDLAYIKDRWAQKHQSARERRGSSSARIKREDSTQSINDDDFFTVDEPTGRAQGFRALKIPVADDIRQLVMSPNHQYLAVLTAYNCLIVLLPDPSHLTADDVGLLKPKVWTLGPTTHVTSRSPIVEALFHPLGVDGSCIVTVTADAIVRVWEMSPVDRWSFDSPTLAVDLKKLADGQTLDQDFSASTAATATAFSPDSFEMQVASAAFASRGSGGWTPMTLFIAMREGNVYALCPLLPQKFAPPPALIPSLATAVIANVAAMEDDHRVSESAKLLAQQQLEWMAEIDAQEPQLVDSTPGDPPAEVYARPSRPGIVPRLQGPFTFEADPEIDNDLDTELTDILVIGKKADTAELMAGEEDDWDLDDGDHEGLSLSIICLLSTSGQVRVYLDTVGVEAQWLPPKGRAKAGRIPTAPEPPALLTFQGIDTMSAVEVSEEAWPVFSCDVLSRYGFFVTHHAGITFISLSPWVFRLESELQAESEAGSDFRLNLLINGQNATRERVFSQPSGDTLVPLAASIVLNDPDVGYFLLSASGHEPITISFEAPEDKYLPQASFHQDTPIPEVQEAPPAVQPLDFYEPRPVYRPSGLFDEKSALPALLERLRMSRYKALVNQEVRLSPVTLSVFTDAHKVLSEETHRLGLAAAELFRRCERLQVEFRDQVKIANQIKDRIDHLTGDAPDDDSSQGGESDNQRFERRIALAQSRQAALAERLETIRKKMARTTTRELSAKEKAFADEVRNMADSVLGPAEAGPDGMIATVKPQGKSLPRRRFEEVKRLYDELAAEADRIAKREAGKVPMADVASSGVDTSSPTSKMPSIPPEIRKAKLEGISRMLARETALVEAVSARLERLQTQ